MDIICTLWKPATMLIPGEVYQFHAHAHAQQIAISDENSRARYQPRCRAYLGPISPSFKPEKAIASRQHQAGTPQIDSQHSIIEFLGIRKLEVS